jgi:hypothetical protein
MTNFNRFLWLLAWGVWVWLGFGLYRELPCSRGSQLRRLPLADKESVLGFLPGGPYVATLRAIEETSASTASVYDASTGATVRVLPWAPRSSWFSQESGIPLPRHGVLLAKAGPPDKDGAPSKGFHVLNLMTGHCRRITASPVQLLAVHRDRPWVLYIEMSKSLTPQRLVAYDLSSNTELLEKALDSSAPVHESHPFFVPGTDLLVVPTHDASESTKSSRVGRFEFWCLGGEGPTRERIVEPARFGLEPHPCRSGRVAYVEKPAGDGPCHVDIVDVETGVVIYSDPPLEKRQSQLRFPIDMVALSPSGETVLFGDRSNRSRRPTVLNVETGRTLWQPGIGEGVSLRDDENTFFVGEGWQISLLQKLLGGPPRVGLWEGWATLAIRDLESGRPLQRYWLSHSPVASGVVGSTSIAIHGGGSICRPPSNLTLLALCQTILALPLVLLWAVLRWRRKRKLRRAAA